MLLGNSPKSIIVSSATTWWYVILILKKYFLGFLFELTVIRFFFLNFDCGFLGTEGYLGQADPRFHQSELVEGRFYCPELCTEVLYGLLSVFRGIQ